MRQGKEILRISIEGADRNAVITAAQALDSVDLIDPIDGDENCYEIQSRPEMSSRKTIFKMCCDNGWFLTELTPIQTKLEDIFHELTMN